MAPFIPGPSPAALDLCDQTFQQFTRTRAGEIGGASPVGGGAAQKGHLANYPELTEASWFIYRTLRSMVSFLKLVRRVLQRPIPGSSDYPHYNQGVPAVTRLLVGTEWNPLVACPRAPTAIESGSSPTPAAADAPDSR